jgi:peptide/nickel transport system permease protein
MPVILWTDALVFLLIVIASVAIIKSFYNQESQQRWNVILQHPSRIIAIIFLLAFILIGLLDCMHYHTPNMSGSLRSILDWLLLPISADLESSYSAPFATHEFVAKMVKDASGNITWVKDKLQHVNPVPIWPLVATALLQTLLIAVGAYLLLRKYRSKRMLTTLLTIGFLLALTLIVRQLIPHYHIFGTDKIGVDVFYASLKSIRTGLIIGTITTMITLPFAVLFGAMAGYFRGWTDDIVQYTYIMLSSIPGVLLIAAAMLSLDVAVSRHDNAFLYMEQRSDVRLLLLCSILGLTSWTSLCRILRGETLKLRNQEYILAARVMGLRGIKIITKHILPNLTHIIIISLVLDFSGLVLAEAVLSYVGVGVDPTMFSWGNMINGARMEMGRDPIIWWSLVGAFTFMFVLVLSANIFGDAVRDALDSKAAAYA